MGTVSAEMLLLAAPPDELEPSTHPARSAAGKAERPCLSVSNTGRERRSAGKRDETAAPTDFAASAAIRVASVGVGLRFYSFAPNHRGSVLTRIFLVSCPFQFHYYTFR